MMGRQSSRISMVILDIAELILSNHLLRKINQMVSFDFIYDLVAPYYPAKGRPFVDSVNMFKMDAFTASSQNADLSRKFS